MSGPIQTRLEGHVRHAGPLTDYHGALVPAWYVDPVAEHHAVRRAAGLFDFSFRSRFTAAGNDRVRFIHGMVSNDVKSLVPGRGTYATVLDVRGRILADLRIYCAEDHLILETDADLLDKTLQALNHYNIGNRVPLEPLEEGTLAVQGPASRGIMEEAFGIAQPIREEFGHLTVTFAGFPIRILRANETGEEGYEIWIQKDGLPVVWDVLVRAGENYGMVSSGSAALETLRIEAGIPKYGSELGEDTLLLEAGLLNAVSFTKGCYIGQEIVERARSRGHVNWKLVGLWLKPDVTVKKEAKLVADGKEVGEITSACLSPTLGKTIALAYVRRDASEPGTMLSLSTGEQAEVTQLPFYGRREGLKG